MRKFLMSDGHLGHRYIDKLRPRNREGEPGCKRNSATECKELVNDGFIPLTSAEQHEATVEEVLKLGKRDLLFLLGDFFFTEEWLSRLLEARCRMVLIGGNHDVDMAKIAATGKFEQLIGITRHKSHWLTHAPIHPQELRGFKNIHGHLHWQLIVDENKEPDTRYKNVCMEYTDFKPVEWEYVVSDEYDQECRRKWEYFKTKNLILPY